MIQVPPYLGELKNSQQQNKTFVSKYTGTKTELGHSPTIQLAVNECKPGYEYGLVRLPSWYWGWIAWFVCLSDSIYALLVAGCVCPASCMTLFGTSAINMNLDPNS